MPLGTFRSPSGPAGTARVVRDRTTVTLYAGSAVWGWLLYSFNPSVPLLARDLHVSDALAGLHGTAMAAGGVLAAFLAPRAVTWWGRRAAIVAACAAVVAGTLGLVGGPSLGWTLTAMALLATGGSALIALVQVGLALRHGPTAAAVISETNAVGSGVGLLGPLAVGAAVSVGWGWRPGVLVTALLAVVVATLVERLPDSAVLPRGGGRRLRRTVAVAVAGGTSRADVSSAGPAQAVGPRRRARWRPTLAPAMFIGGVVAANAVENATDYWSTALLIDRTDAGAGIATAATAGLVAGMTAVRLVISPLSLRVDPVRLLVAGFALNVAGWAVLWTTTSTGVALAGLVLAGLGMGVQYPLSIALLLAASPGHSDRAQGGATLCGALAIGVAPFLLGVLADHVGMHTAFVVVPTFALLGGVTAAVGGWALRRVGAGD